MNIKKYIPILAALAILTGLSACQDEPYRYRMTDGLPSVYFIRPTGQAADTLLTSAYMGNSLTICGDNLRSIYEIWFNDQKAILNTSYMTDHTVIVDVPNTIPGRVTDKIYFKNKNKEVVEFEFNVLVPGPSLTGLSCEYAKPGTEVTLSGDYFVDDEGSPLTVTFENGGPAEIKTITQNKLSFVVPEEASEGTITVSTVYGETTSAFRYMDSRGIIFTFDDDSPLMPNGWHFDAAVIETDETAVDGNYARLGDPSVTMTENGAWDDNHYMLNYWCGEWSDPVTYANYPRVMDIVDVAQWKDMAFKFEMMVPSANAWGAGMMQVMFCGTDMVTNSDDRDGAGGIDVYGNHVRGTNWCIQDNALARGLYQPWTPIQMYDTADQWITVTMPFKDFDYTFDGSAATREFSENNFGSLTIFVVGGITGQECNPVIKLDNLRIVPIK